MTANTGFRGHNRSYKNRGVTYIIDATGYIRDYEPALSRSQTAPTKIRYVIDIIDGTGYIRRNAGL